jgi:DNA-binding NtrC family response regulator
MSNKRILLLDHDRDWMAVASESLIRDGYDVFTVDTFTGALEMLKARQFDVLVADINQGDSNPEAALQELLSFGTGAKLIVCTARPSLSQATQFGKMGIFDYLDRTDHASSLAALRQRLDQAVRENDTLLSPSQAVTDIMEQSPVGGEVFHGLVSRNWRMHGVFELIQTISSSSVSVIIEGETGTGKELVAHAIHDCSARRGGPFVTLDCSTLSHELLESELFGHEKGSFTGASERRIGRFERADGGTLFLDEVSNISLPVQAKLLRVLETHTFERVGGQRPVAVDVRIVAASNRHLDQCVADKSFREDLYHRLNVVQIVIPPLRQRAEDIPLLANYFVRRLSQAHGKDVRGLTNAAVRLLCSYAWPGNVRELENVLLQAVVLAQTPMLDVTNLPTRIWNPAGADLRQPSTRLTEQLREPEKEILVSTLKQVNGNITQAAALLQISRTTLYAKLKKHGINPDEI